MDRAGGSDPLGDLAADVKGGYTPASIQEVKRQAGELLLAVPIPADPSVISVTFSAGDPHPAGMVGPQRVCAMSGRPTNPRSGAKTIRITRESLD